MLVKASNPVEKHVQKTARVRKRFGNQRCNFIFKKQGWLEESESNCLGFWRVSGATEQ